MDSEIRTARDASVGAWLSALGEATGSPGGGAAAGVMLAIAASLTSMVAGYTEPSDEQRDGLGALRERARMRARVALQLADDDAEASDGFGAAFRLPPGRERDAAVERASVAAARTSAVVGERAGEGIADLEWLAEHGNPALVSDIAVACGALRAAIAGARTNVSFDLASLTSTGRTHDDVRGEHPQLWSAVERFTSDLARLDALEAALDPRAAPTEAAGEGEDGEGDLSRPSAR
ncbi:formiminotetrahydrofolate cyclodeaminase [Microbacterium sp. AK009]|uniref:cyclodeaminase/cyclohydrolase family protein n=1 Tax=Microbacterium sp. AK009 TaxID=2723068 RepID=UPI0015CDF122|nr:cyclodeaminase/cyclohydrolase family protein [Microbacterium sp. AK009]NYF17994.1 formiminotetrahydrofolate cyclodeaminase [Microbacterium sp. AK009]